MGEANAVTEPILVAAVIEYTTHDGLDRYVSAVELQLHDDKLVYSFRSININGRFTCAQIIWNAQNTTRDRLKRVWRLMGPYPDITDLRLLVPGQIRWVRSKLAKAREETK